MSLVLGISEGDHIWVGKTKVTFYRKGKDRRVAIDGPREVTVLRGSLVIDEAEYIKSLSGPFRLQEYTSVLFLDYPNHGAKCIWDDMATYPTEEEVSKEYAFALRDEGRTVRVIDEVGKVVFGPACPDCDECDGPCDRCRPCECQEVDE